MHKHQINAVIYITLSLYYNNYYHFWSILQAINCSTDIITHGLCCAAVMPHMCLQSNDAWRTKKNLNPYITFPILISQLMSRNNAIINSVEPQHCTVLTKWKLLLNMPYSHILSTFQLKTSQMLKGQLLGQITVRKESKLHSKCCWICLKPQELSHRNLRLIKLL